MNVFNSRLHVMNLLIYRSFVSDNPPKSSWLWHYDDNPKEFIKLMIYLTDVTEDSGPFEYLRHRDTQQSFMPTKIRTGFRNWNDPPQWPEGRVPDDELERLQKQGYEPFKVIGKKGTILLFNANSIHRATIPKSKPRDALVLVLKPTKQKLHPFIHPKWTGTFEHHPLEMDPSCIKPAKKGSTSTLVRGASRRLSRMFRK